MTPRTALVGILNITPDSFSDGGDFLDAQSALTHAEQLLRDGATIIDIGAESTRPGAVLLSPEQEWTRLAPVLEPLIALAATHHAEISLDTRHPETARRALALGVSWINDQSGITSRVMRTTLANASCKVVLMHSLGLPADPRNTFPEDADAVQLMKDFFVTRLRDLEKAGIARDRIILDPGIGFGKTAEQSVALLSRVDELQSLGLPLFIGHSRKSFLKLYSDAPAAERDEATLVFSEALMKAGVDYLRVHNVAAHFALLQRLSV